MRCGLYCEYLADLTIRTLFPNIQGKFQILKSSGNRPELGEGGENLGKISFFFSTGWVVNGPSEVRAGESH